MIQFSQTDLQTPEQLERLLQQFNSAISTLQQQGNPTSPSMATGLVNQLLPLIKNALQSTGSNPLNLQSLPQSSSVISGVATIAQGGTGQATAPAALAALGGATAASITGITLTLAKITSGGADGSITISGQGIITAYTAPT